MVKIYKVYGTAGATSAFLCNQCTMLISDATLELGAWNLTAEEDMIGDAVPTVRHFK